MIDFLIEFLSIVVFYKFKNSIYCQCFTSIMEFGNNVKNTYLESIDKLSTLTDETKDKMVEILKELLPSLLGYYDLNDLFVKDQNEALSQLFEKMVESPFSFESESLIVEEYPTLCERLIKKLERLDDHDPDEMLMFLFYAVSSFENMVNYHLFVELEIRSLYKDEIEGILKLQFDDKLSGLLMLTYESRYTNNENWKIIKKFIQIRNFFIHYKPVTWERYDHQYDILNKESFKNFLDASCNCYFYLKEHHSDKCKKHFDTIKSIKTLLKDM